MPNPSSPETISSQSEISDLRRREQLLADFFDNGAVGLHWVGPDGIILRANRTELELLGYPEAEYVGRHIAEFHADAPVIEEILRKLSSGATLHNFEARLRCKSGEIKHVLISSNVLWEDGKFIHTRCFTRDVTEQKQAEQALRDNEQRLAAAYAAAERANRAKDDFLARLSHELRNPLNPVLLIASEGATNEELPPPVRADFIAIQQNVEFEARLIDDLLDLTRIAQGKLSLRLEPINLNNVLNTAVRLIQSDAMGKHQTITCEIHAADCVLIGDIVRLQQVFVNLLCNAVKFTPAGGTIRLWSHNAENGEIVVDVIDTGIGMTATEMAQIFDPFTQGSHATARGAHKYGGLGLGLAISRSLIEMHGGKIEARSDGPGKGSTFSVRLPSRAGS